MGERFSNTNAIDDRAGEWVVRLDNGAPDPVARAELDAWLAQDARHRGAFLRAEAVWKNFDRLAILAGDNEAPHAQPAFSENAISRRHLLAAGGGAAVLAAAAASVAAYMWTGYHEVLTPLGEIRRVPLADGSLAAVNTDSKLNIALKPGLREITLDKGEVWFDVAKDAKRPFVVAAGEVRVRAVGTAFSVRRCDDGADVLVTEGVIEAWTVGVESGKCRVEAGSRVFISDIAGPSTVVAAAKQIERKLAWREGEIALDGDTLADAATEFNRYNQRKITVDPSLTDKQLVGWFRTNEPENFAQAVATTVGAVVVESGDEIHLAPKPEP